MNLLDCDGVKDSYWKGPVPIGLVKSVVPAWMMLVFGLIGYAFNKLGYPLAPLVLAIVLGDKAEEGFRQALLGSQGGLGVFFSNWLVASIMGLGLVLLFWPAIGWLKSRFAGSEPPAATS